MIMCNYKHPGSDIKIMFVFMRVCLPIHVRKKHENVDPSEDPHPILLIVLTVKLRLTKIDPNIQFSRLYSHVILSCDTPIRRVF